MNDISIDNLNLEELKKLLKELNLYNNLRKQLGDRGKILYSQLKTGRKIIQVEYFPVLNEDLVWEKTEECLKNVFSLDAERKNIVFIPKEDLSGGMKIYVDDEVLDLSYQKVETTLRK